VTQTPINVLNGKSWNTKQNAHMKIKNRIRKAQFCLLTVALISIVAALSARAAATPLNARIIPRPLTPGDITRNNLSASLEVSGGLSTFAIGTPAYLEADVNIAIVPSTITGVTWTLTTKPIGSAAVLTANPLPLTLPEYLPSDRLVYQVAARTLLRPDLVGQYTVSATITTATNGTTNVSANFTVATYMGVEVCAYCHSGNNIGTPDIYPSWTTTAHASIFTEGIDGILSSHYSQSCIKCHTTGYDTNASALNDGGFYGVAQEDGWTFPTNLSNTNLARTNYSSMPANLQNVANITCENCHGPGQQHAYAFGDTNAVNWPLLDVPYTVGTCEECHDSPPTEAYGAQWLASSHAVTTTIPTTSSSAQYCVRCHTAAGFINIISNNAAGDGIVTSANTTYSAIGCQTCHEPHGLTTPTNDNHLIRDMASATFGDGTVITNGGEGNVCMNCHHSRDGSAVTNVMNYPLGLNTWAGGSSFGPHDGVQGDMIEGTNAITYGLSIPSSAHRLSVTNSCVGCHMQTIASTDPGFLLSGGHTFEMSYNVVTNGVTNKIDQVAVCNQCHGGITTFNFPVEDYANVGVILGVQTEVQILLNQLSMLLPVKGGTTAGGVVQTSLSVTTNWTTAQLNAAYNWQFVNNDGSLGVHNAPFATGLLKASIANLTGTSVTGGLPDAWEVEYFGSITNALGAPDADPAGDGIPNWLKYSLGLDPLVAGLAVPNGVVYADGNALGGSTNTIQIYTAADVTFNTVAGTTYQIQEVSTLSGGWQNVGGPILATNTASMSYLTPTVGNLQQFFRVVSTP
jgi:hypothetical protein